MSHVIDGTAHVCIPHELVPEFRASACRRQNIFVALRKIMGSIRNGGAISLGALQKVMSRAVDISEEDLQSSPAPLRGYFEDFTVHHSVNVCLLTARAASLVIKDREQLRRIALAALLHDIGKSTIAADILNKPDRLNPDESAQLQRHQIRGARILLNITNVDPLCVTVVYGHHLRQPEATPPTLTHGFEPDWITRLVAVTDVFETLTAVRPYKSAMSVESAFRAMVQMSTLMDHLPLIKLLYESLGPYPVGTFVELNSGERGVVLARNRSHPSQPATRILTDERRRVLTDPLDLDLAEAGWGQSTPRRVARALVRHDPDESLLDMEARPDPVEILGSPIHDDVRLMEREG